ncbi:hypothetical protein DCAR_0730187 [Daucus carota subsp. sativus]|uniref:Uncharacterized protein n=1 Tax=Daucus carota subsp. sativus TaxID=79200 RepID=A0A161ZNX3_DAUCS|nr:hypothetical protein DCAR_0730187 [Daucus carota subsp. sativus]
MSSNSAQQSMSQQETETKVQAMQERDQLTDKALSQHAQKSASELTDFAKHELKSHMQAVEQAKASADGTTEAAKSATETNK